MHSLIRVGLAFAALAAVPVPLEAADDAAAERAFSVAARSFTNCLLDAVDGDRYDRQKAAPRADLANACLLQEAAFRQNGVRLRLSRGQAEQQALNEAEADILNGRRMALADQAQRYALAH